METKTILSNFFEAFFNQHDLSAADKYLSPNYIQHDWDVSPGREGFRKHFGQVFQRFPQFHVQVHHIIEDGDIAAVHGYGVTEPGEIEVLVVDIYRMENGLLKEHWGTVQQLPAEQFGNPALME